MSRTFWTESELAILREVYPTGGSGAVYAAGVRRNKESIGNKARLLGIRRTNRVYLKQTSTPEIDECIRREYRQGRPNLKALARRIGREYGWTKWRSGELGLRRTKEPRWTPEEDVLLEECIEKHQSVTTIARKFRLAGYARSATSIRSRMDYLGVMWQRDYWTARNVESALGINEKTVVRLIKSGKLKAKQARAPSRDDLPNAVAHLHWQIKATDLRSFMVEHPAEWDHRRMRKEVLLDLLCGGRAGMNAGGLGVDAARRLAG